MERAILCFLKSPDASWYTINERINNKYVANKYFDACPPIHEIIWRDATSEMGLYTYMYRPAY